MVSEYRTCLTFCRSRWVERRVRCIPWTLTGTCLLISGRIRWRWCLYSYSMILSVFGTPVDALPFRRIFQRTIQGFHKPTLRKPWICNTCTAAKGLWVHCQWWGFLAEWANAMSLRFSLWWQLQWRAESALHLLNVDFNANGQHIWRPSTYMIHQQYGNPTQRILWRYKKNQIVCWVSLSILSYARIPWKIAVETHKHPEQPCYYPECEARWHSPDTRNPNWQATSRTCWSKRNACTDCCRIYLIEIDDVGYLVPGLRIEQGAVAFVIDMTWSML